MGAYAKGSIATLVEVANNVEGGRVEIVDEGEASEGFEFGGGLVFESGGDLGIEMGFAESAIDACFEVDVVIKIVLEGVEGLVVLGLPMECGKEEHEG